jgi:hypothetical protein
MISNSLSISARSRQSLVGASIRLVSKPRGSLDVALTQAVAPGQPTDLRECDRARP